MGNWRIKNRNNLHNTLAHALYKLTLRGGGIGANIHNLDELNQDLQPDDVNDNYNLEELN